MHEHPWPKTAEALMRSRFAAVRDADAEWLLASWHPSTWPASPDLTDNPTWRGLQIIDTVAGGPDDDTGIVEFLPNPCTDCRSDLDVPAVSVCGNHVPGMTCGTESGMHPLCPGGPVIYLGWVAGRALQGSGIVRDLPETHYAGFSYPVSPRTR